MGRVLLCLAAAVLLAGATPPAERPAQVVVLGLDGAIQPAALRYLERGLGAAARSGAQLVVLELDTPGGLLVSLREMTTAITRSRVPVAVFVAPPGARAASAGFFLLIAADVAAMAPGTNAGAAHPVAIGGRQQPQGDETAIAKAAEDAAALIRALADERGRSIDWAERAVTESLSYTAVEAEQRGLIDVVVPDLDALLAHLDGAAIRRFDGKREVLALHRAPIERVELTFAERLLMVIADPQVAYLLMTLGMLGLLVELTNPGAIVPGVAGGICLLLGLYGLSVLPVNWSGALLIVLGIALLIAEAFVASYGLLGAAGIASFVLGSLMLVDTPAPGGSIGLALIVPAAAVLAVVGIVLLGQALRLRRAPPRGGLEGLIGEVGELTAPVEQDSAAGKVFVHGEYWNATGERPLPAGTRVRVEAIEGSTLRVAPVEHAAR